MKFYNPKQKEILKSGHVIVRMNFLRITKQLKNLIIQWNNNK